jgi:hypothetical protein
MIHRTGPAIGPIHIHIHIHGRRYPCACCQPGARCGPRRGVRYNGDLTLMEVVSG